jgi:hypothetical protein
MRGGERSGERRLRGYGWLLLILGSAAAAIAVVAGALGARDTAQFGHWVGWATVLGVPIAAAGVTVAAWGKITGREPGGGRADGVIGDELAAVVLEQAQEARSLLIGPGEAGDRAAGLEDAHQVLTSGH